MAEFDPVLAHDRLHGRASAADRWAVSQQLFREQGVGWVTAGTAPRQQMHAVTVRTSVPGELMADYIAEQLFLEDPWISHSAQSTALDVLDLEQRQPGAMTGRCQKMRSVFADHGLRRVCLLPVYSGARPGALVLYAVGQDEARALRDPRHLHRLRQLSAIVAAHWRPEDETADRPPGTYFLNPVLAQREGEVLLWLTRGFNTAQIAHHMGIAPVTVGKHLRAARQKLGARTREQALAVAIRDGLISP